MLKRGEEDPGTEMTTQGPQSVEPDPLQVLLNEAETLIQNLDTTGGAQLDDVPGMAENAFSIDSDEEDDPSSGEVGNKKVEVEDHPLSDEWLSAPTPQTSAAPEANGTPTSTSTAATMDAFKQQTSRFASNLASMAQRAAREVAAATTPVVPPQGGPVSLAQAT